MSKKKKAKKKITIELVKIEFCNQSGALGALLNAPFVDTTGLYISYVFNAIQTELKAIGDFRKQIKDGFSKEPTKEEQTIGDMKLLEFLSETIEIEFIPLNAGALQNSMQKIDMPFSAAYWNSIKWMLEES